MYNEKRYGLRAEPRGISKCQYNSYKCLLGTFLVPDTVSGAGEIAMNGWLKFISWWREIINKETHKNQKETLVTDRGYAEG